MGSRSLTLLLFFTSLLSAQSITLTSPSGNPTWNGWVSNDITWTISSAPNAGLMCINIDAHNATNPGPVGVVAGNLGSFLAEGCVPASQGYYPVNSFEWLNGPRLVILSLYDNDNNVIATTNGTFNTTNSFPIPWSPSLSVTTGTNINSTWANQVSGSSTISGSGSSDSFTHNWFMDGQSQLVVFLGNNNSSFSFDTTAFYNGPVNIAYMALDNTQGLQGVNNGAAEYSRTVIVNNGTTPVETWANVSDANLILGGPSGGSCGSAPSTVGSCIITPKIVNADGSTSSGTFYYTLSNTNSTISSNTGSSITVTSAAIGNTKLYVTGVMENGTDGVGHSGNLSEFSSASYNVRYTDYGNVIYITGGTNCIIGAYKVVDAVVTTNFLLLGSPSDPGSTSSINFLTGTTTGCTWFMGQTDVVWVNIGNTLPIVSHYSTCGTVLTTYVATGNCKSQVINELFLSNEEFSSQYYVKNYGQSFSDSGFNTVELPIVNSSTCLTGTQAQCVSSATAFINTQLALIAPWPNLRAFGRWDNWIDSFSNLIQLTKGTPSSWNPTGAATVMQILTNTGMFLVGDLLDEIDGHGFTLPLQGIINPVGMGTIQNWFNNIICNNGTCTVNTFTTTPGGQYNLGNNFIISGSSTLALNSNSPSVYARTPVNSTSFKFTNSSIPNGTYNDSGLTIQPFGAGGWVLNNLTNTQDYLHYDGWASLINQFNSVSPHVPVESSVSGDAGLISNFCWGRTINNVCGQSLTIGGNVVNRIPDTNEIYWTHLPPEQYLRARTAIYPIFSSNSIFASLEESYKIKNLRNVIDPSWPQLTITQGVSSEYIFNGGTNQYNVTSCNGYNITLASNPNVPNILPGGSRLTVTGSSDSNCNTNFIIIGNTSPNVFQVVYAATKTACTSSCIHNAGSATLIFQNGDKIGVGGNLLNSAGNVVPLYEVMTDGLTVGMGAGSSIFNYGNATFPNNGCGALNTPNLVSPAVTRHRGQFLSFQNVQGTDATYYNGTTFYYDVENLALPTDANGSSSTCNNFIREVPSLSGTGGSAQIIPHNLLVMGQVTSSFIAGLTDPNYATAGIVNAEILGMAGHRQYSAHANPQAYNPIAYNTNQKGGWPSTSLGRINIFNESYSTQTNQLGIHPNVENNYSIPNWMAGNFPSKMWLKNQKFYLGATKLNSPNYGHWIASAAFKSQYGYLLIVTNATNGPQTRTINLCSDPHVFCTSGQNFIRYLMDARGIYPIETINFGTANESLTLQEGQTAYYEFPFNFISEMNIPSIGINTSDFPGMSGFYVRFAYDQYYIDSNPATVFDCQMNNPCKLPMDLTIPGLHYYKLLPYQIISGKPVILNYGGLQTL